MQIRALATIVVATMSLAACGSDVVEPAAATVPVVDELPSISDANGWREHDLPGIGAAIGVQETTYEFVIPPGAGDALAAGEPLRIVPARFEAKVGESVRIINNDRQGHNVGPWYVGSNETLKQRFTSPGIYQGLCTVHPSGAMVLEVTDA